MAGKTTTRKRTIIGTFDNSAKAQVALDRLLAQGFAEGEVTVLLSDRSQGKHFAIDAKHKVPEGAALGALIGGIVGAVAIGITAVAGLAIPGIDLFASGWPIAALAGGGAGGLLGWLIGGLVGLGFDEHEAKLVEEREVDGHIVLGVQTRSDEKAKFAERAFEDEGATSVAA